MTLCRFPRWLALPAGVFLGLTVWAGEPVKPAREALPPAVPPSLEVKAAAAKLGWSAGPLVLTTEPGLTRSGDGVVALITLWTKGGQKQWLVQFEIEPMTEKEKKNAKSQFTATIDMGGPDGHWEFSGVPTLALNIRALGPYVTLPYNAATAARSADDKTGRALINEEFLTLGLDRACRVGVENLRAGKRADDAKDLPKEDKKAMAGAYASLFQFFVLAREIPGLKGIMWEVMDLPPLWTFIKGVSPGFGDGGSSMAELDPAGWSLPARPLYRFPFGLKLNGKPSVNSTFFVVASEPPILTTAGIVGFTAHSPSHPEKRVQVQIVSAYREKVVEKTETPEEGKPTGEKR